MIIVKIEEEILNLKKMVVKMAELVYENLSLAMENYYSYQIEKANLIRDDLVDAYEREIEEMCLNLMLKERPFAKDLRFISGVLTLVADLERLGDHAEDIVSFASRMQKCKHEIIPSLDEAFKESMKMVSCSIRSFVQNDISLAEKVIKKDDDIDALYEKSVKDIIEKLNQHIFSSDFAIYSTLVVKYIERIADHAVNVCEWVIYIHNGYYKDTQMF